MALDDVITSKEVIDLVYTVRDQNSQIKELVELGRKHEDLFFGNGKNEQGLIRRQDALETRIASLEEKMKSLIETMTWLVRGLLLAAILGVAGFIWYLTSHGGTIFKFP